MKLSALFVVLAALVAPVVAQTAPPPETPATAYLFSYFIDNGQDGLHLAWSRDGLKWDPLNGGRSFLRPEISRDRLMRDSCVAQGPDGTFHLVWTDSWSSRTIGYASTKDFRTWSPQKELDVMKHEPTTRNCWAPEVVYDAARQQFIIFWASTIPGRFPRTEYGGKNDNNHRIYATTTKDFETFTATTLFFDPGFNVIDSTLLPLNGKFYLFSKDESKVPAVMKNLRLAVADDIAGPYVIESAPINRPGAWVEGPTTLQIGDTTYLYFDAYRDHHYGALRSKDLKTWEDVTSRLSMPKGARHGTTFAVSGELVRSLLSGPGAAPAVQPAPSPAVPPAASAVPASSWKNPLIPQRADPHVNLHSDGFYYFTATVPAYDRIELRRARTIGELPTAETKTIWRKHETGPMGAHIWAPEIHFIDGKWYVYFAAGDANAIWNIRMYVLENPSANPLEGEWTEKGQIKMEWESFTLDATTFTHRGVRYLAWAQSLPNVRGTSIFIAKMDTPWSITGRQVMVTKPDQPWERIGHNVNEGPSVLIRNGRVFMTYSASATDANYCLGLLTADENADLLDPASWKKSPAPVFKSDALAGQFGPGHNCFTTTPDGRTDLLVYHARNYEKIQGDPLHNPDRATRVQVLRWNADGTPDFGTPVPDGDYR